MISQGRDLGIFVSGEILTYHLAARFNSQKDQKKKIKDVTKWVDYLPSMHRAPSKDCNPSTRMVETGG